MNDSKRTFNASKVEFAYSPSGKGNAMSIVYMTIFGIIASLIAGSILPFLQYITGSLLSGKFCLLSILAFVLVFFGFAVGLGFLQAKAISIASELGKNRNPKNAAIIAAITSLPIVITYVLVRNSIFEYEAFDSFMDYLKVITNAGMFAGYASYYSWQNVCKKPFCEKCNTFMKNIKSHRMNHDNGQIALSSLRTGKIDKLNNYFEGQDDNVDKNYAIIHFFYCDNCRDSIINMTLNTTITKKTEGSTKEKTESKLIFSRKFLNLNIEDIIG